MVQGRNTFRLDDLDLFSTYHQLEPNMIAMYSTFACVYQKLLTGQY